MGTLAIVTPNNLGADFDIGSRVPGKISLNWGIAPSWTSAHAFGAGLAAAYGAVDTAAWSTLLDGTSSPRPTNFATRMSGAIDVPFPAVVGLSYLYTATASFGINSTTVTLAAPPPGGISIVGQPIVYGSAFQSGTTITAISGTTLTISKTTLAAKTGGVLIGIQQPLGYTGHDQLAQHLIQAVTKKDFNTQESALVVNLISETGAGSHDTTCGDFSEKVGFYLPVLMRPGSANCWAENPDLVIQPGVGYQSAFVRETDFTNFNGPYTPGGSGYGVACHDFRTLTGFPVTASELWSGATPNNGTQTVSATLSASTSISFSSPSASGLSVGDMVTGTGIPAFTYVTSITPTSGSASTTAVNVASGTAILSSAATISGTSTLSITTFNAFLGISASGTTLIRDTLIADGTNSRISYKVYGTHNAGFDTTSATLTYAMIMAPGHYVSFNNGDATFRYSGSTLIYSANGGTPLTITGAASGVNGVNITSGGTGYGPIIQPAGTDTNTPLNLQGKGTSPVQVLGPLIVVGQTTHQGITVDASYTVATAPTGFAGAHAYFSNARKVGEASGSGTGVIAYYSNGAWRRFSDDTAIAA